MTDMVLTTGAIRRAKLQSNHHHQQTDTQLFTGRMPFLSPNQQCQSNEGKSSVIFVLTYFLVLVLVLVFEIFFSFSFVLVFIIFSF